MIERLILSLTPTPTPTGETTSLGAGFWIGIAIAVAVPAIVTTVMIIRILSSSQDLGLRGDGTTDHFGGMPRGTHGGHWSSPNGW